MAETEDIIDAPETLPATAEHIQQQPDVLGAGMASPMSVADGMSLLPVEQQEVLLAEYDLRRNFFLRWLLSHFVAGAHYGFPPGCEGKYDAQGNLLLWNKRTNTNIIVPPSSWRPKPSLYKAGALLVVDLLKLRPSYEADQPSWEQMGSPVGTFVMRCILADKRTGTVLGEGRGIYAVNQKGMTANAAIKMAEKCALVDATISTVPVMGDLFTQDKGREPGDEAAAAGAMAGIDPYKPKSRPEPAAEPEGARANGAPETPADSARAKAVYNELHRVYPAVDFFRWSANVVKGFDAHDKATWTWQIVEQLEAGLAAMIQQDRKAVQA